MKNQNQHFTILSLLAVSVVMALVVTISHIATNDLQLRETDNKFLDDSDMPQELAIPVTHEPEMGKKIELNQFETSESNGVIRRTLTRTYITAETTLINNTLCTSDLPMSRIHCTAKNLNLFLEKYAVTCEDKGGHTAYFVTVETFSGSIEQQLSENESKQDDVNASLYQLDKYGDQTIKIGKRKRLLNRFGISRSKSV